LKSPIHHLDPRTKVILSFFYLLAVVLTPPEKNFQFFPLAGGVFGIILISRLPLKYVLKRILLIVPFILLVVLFLPFDESMSSSVKFRLLWNIFIKSCLSILSMVILVSTTRFSLLLKGLEFFKFPRLVILLLSFMYRYIFVLIDEAMRMERARRMRYFGGRLRQQVKTMAKIVGFLFIRSYERGERVYQSMLARGFEGRIFLPQKLKFSLGDLWASLIFFTTLVLIKLKIT
jgi:cobalt/nickel transport system permease protein